MAKKIYYSSKAKNGIRNGVNHIADAVKSTLGPKGKLVGIEKKYGTQHLTKDGVTVAKEIELSNPLENFGAQVIKEAASKTADLAGDGTTSATVIAQSIYNFGLKYLAAGANPVSLQRGLNKAAQEALKYIDSNAKKIDAKDLKQLEQVATISANNDPEMGKKIAEVIHKVGKDGVVSVEEYQGTGIVEEYVEGMQIDRGFISPYFVTDSTRQEAVIEDAHILITDTKISSIKTILPVIEKLMESNSKNLVIVTEDLDGDALTNLVVNKLRGVLNVVAIKAPGFGDRKKELLEDIAILTGGNVISEELGRKLDDTVELSDLGKVRRFVCDKDNSTFIEGKGDKNRIDARIKQIKAQIEITTSEYDIEKLEERLAKLTGGVAVIKVGAATEVQMKEIKDRLDDAIHATKAALDGGIVSGGGIAYLNASNYLKDFKLEGDEGFGVDILRRSLKEPSLQILINAGVESAEKITADCQEKGDGIGYDVMGGQNLINMIDAGIVDPAKVVKNAIQNATSASSTLLATEVVIVDVPEAKDKSATDPDMDGGMGDFDM